MVQCLHQYCSFKKHFYSCTHISPGSSLESLYHHIKVIFIVDPFNPFPVVHPYVRTADTSGKSEIISCKSYKAQKAHSMIRVDRHQNSIISFKFRSYDKKISQFRWWRVDCQQYKSSATTLSKNVRMRENFYSHNERYDSQGGGTIK